ncbi:MAG: AAA family ATPase [Phycisphaerales bacterium]|jgi:cellulose biosynthesis protein BcsQ|nr:AAA family ATPase [Phycisphaerales bacterium]
MRTIAIINQKGGCGKTTSAINLAGVWAKRGIRTLLVDLDPQSHCAAGLGIPEARIDLDIADALLTPARSVDQSRLLWRVARGLDLAPSRMKLAGLEAARGGLADKPDKERRLANLLHQFAGDYDAAIIDCPPSIGLLTFNALTAATTVLIPVETGYFALQGAAKQVQTVESLNRRIGVQTPVRLFGTLHDPDDVHSSALLDELRRQFADRVAPVAIRRDPKLKEAAAFGRPIIDHDHESHGSIDYALLSDWLLSIVGMSAEASAATGASPVRVVTSPATAAEVAHRVASAGETLRPGPHEVAAITDTTPELAAVESGHSIRTPHEPSHAVIHAKPHHAESTPIHRAEIQASHASSLVRGGIGSHDTPVPVTPSAAASSAKPAHAAPSLEPLGESRISRAQDVARRAQKLLRREHEHESPTNAATSTTANVTPAQPIHPNHTPEPTRVTLIHDPLEVAEPVKSPSGVARLFGVRVTRQGVLFVQPDTLGSEVSVAGTFNNWSPDIHRLRANPQLGVLELCIPVPPGRHSYRLIIDGRWCADSFNPGTEVNPFGEHNSVVNVE